MATLYDIDAAMAALIDPETGEIADYEAFETLQMERDAKIANMIRWYKNEAADAEAIAREYKTLQEREKSHRNRAERIKGYIERSTARTPYKCAVGAVTYRKSVAVELGDSFIGWARECGGDSLLRFKDPEPDKAAIKEALLAGRIPQMVQDNGIACLVERNNISIK